MNLLVLILAVLEKLGVEGPMSLGLLVSDIGDIGEEKSGAVAEL